jgi:uncharacterized protein YggT (Ycf19 family)
MGLIDFILNVAGLLLWLNWRAIGFDPLTRSSPATLVGTLRRAEPRRVKRWYLLAALAGLLLLRALFYWQIGSAVNWTANLKLVSISPPFSSDFFSRMLLFSILSFGLTLGVFFLGLLFLSCFDRRGPETDPLQKLTRLQLGRVGRWPWPVKLALPLLAGTVLWWLLSWPLERWGIIPRPVSQAHRLEQAVLIGLGSYLAWQYLIAGLLALHLVNNYVYFGNHLFWNCVNGTARAILAPLRPVPLHVGRVDFAPVLGIALVFLFARLAGIGLTWLYPKLPL